MYHRNSLMDTKPKWRFSNNSLAAYSQNKQTRNHKGNKVNKDSTAKSHTQNPGKDRKSWKFIDFWSWRRSFNPDAVRSSAPVLIICIYCELETTMLSELYPHILGAVSAAAICVIADKLKSGSCFLFWHWTTQTKISFELMQLLWVPCLEFILEWLLYTQRLTRWKWQWPPLSFLVT